MHLTIEGLELILVDFDNILHIFKEKKIVVFYYKH